MKILGDIRSLFLSSQKANFELNIINLIKKMFNKLHRELHYIINLLIKTNNKTKKFSN